MSQITRFMLFLCKQHELLELDFDFMSSFSLIFIQHTADFRVNTRCSHTHTLRVIHDHSLRGSFDEPLKQASLVVFQQREIEAVFEGAPTGPTFLYWLHLHQRAMGMVEHHKTLRAV